jgi:hypothetical protein
MKLENAKGPNHEVKEEEKEEERKNKYLTTL